MNREFTASKPQQVFVEVQSGDVQVAAAPVDTATVEVTGDDADHVDVEQRDDNLTIVSRRRAGLFVQRGELHIRVVVPTGSDLVTRLGSASVSTDGRLRTARISTGSGHVEVEEVGEELVVKTGSGRISVRRVGGEATLKTGSGAISVGHLAGEATLVTGSGDIDVARADRAVSLKSGSGDLVVGAAEGHAVLSAASGDLRVGRMARGQVHLKNVSGDIRLGVPEGTPVWTDITTGTGNVRSGLTPTGAPEQGQDYVEVRAKSVTGDIYLEQSKE